MRNHFKSGTNLKYCALLVVSIVFFTGCDSPSNTNIVKNATLSNDHTVFIGDAFENYKYFTKTEWKEFATSQGREIVEFNGYYSEKEAVVIIQFAISKDNSLKFELVYVGYSSMRTDSEKEAESLPNSVIDSIYSSQEIQFSIGNVSNFEGDWIVYGDGFSRSRMITISDVTKGSFSFLFINYSIYGTAVGFLEDTALFKASGKAVSRSTGNDGELVMYEFAMDNEQLSVHTVEGTDSEGMSGRYEKGESSDFFIPPSLFVYSVISKAFFYSSPDENTRRSTYLVEDDVVDIEEEENGFGYVEYTNEKGQVTKGWLKMSDLVGMRIYAN